MEDFIVQIYKKSMSIQYMQQAALGAFSRDFIMKRNGWTGGAALLEEWMEEEKDSNEKNAAAVLEMAGYARDNYSNDILFSEILTNELIPMLKSMIGDFTGIDVTVGKWRLESAKTGFITVSTIQTGKFLHSTLDPMWEAWSQARCFYRADRDKYAIFGGGLGYLAYQLWSVSGHTAHIYIYAPDIELCSYAKRYGVLDWIPSDMVHFVLNESADTVVQQFLTDTSDKVVVPVEEYKEVYDGIYINELKNCFMNARVTGEFEKNRLINVLRNKTIGYSIDELRDNSFFQEWIVIGAGPSLGENIEFVRDSVGKRTIFPISAALKLLFNQGIKVDITAVADPFEMLLKHINGIEEQTENIPIVADITANSVFLSKYKGPVYFVGTDEDKKNYSLNQEMVPLEYGGTVSSLAIAAAYYLGAKKIYLVGIDLGYPGGKHYSGGGAYEEEDDHLGTHEIKAMDGTMIKSTETFDGFRQCIESQILKHPLIPVINMSKHGALIKGCRAGE